MYQYGFINCDKVNARDIGLIPGSQRSPGEGNDNPLPYSCLKIPELGRIVHGVAKDSDVT